jgi:hypothetical protein
MEVFFDFFDQIPIKRCQKSKLTQNSDSPSNFAIFHDEVCFLSIKLKKIIKFKK